MAYQKYDLTQSQWNWFKENTDKINTKLQEYRSVKQENYFYELCFCICTPQSKAENAFVVQQKLENLDFINNNFDPTYILFDKSHYIRFHNTKAQRLVSLKQVYPEFLDMLSASISPEEIRLWMRKNIKGVGLKEASHFLRNIGYRNLAIIDRHILKHLVIAKVYKEVPVLSSDKKYFEVESRFKKLANDTNLELDQLDLLFWSYETGYVLK